MPTTVLRPHANRLGSSIPKTFQGDRGGSALDEELLAELRAISAQSSSARRFEDPSADGNANVTADKENNTVHLPIKAKETKKKKPSSSAWKKGDPPPWKNRKGKAKVGNSNPFENIQIGSVESEETPPKPKAISNGSKNESQDKENATKRLEFKGTLKYEGAPKEKSVSLSSKKQVDNRPLKNRRPKGKVLKVNPFDNVEIGMQSKLPKTFKGDLGGSARDAGLLSELLEVSNSSNKEKVEESGNNKNVGVVRSIGDSLPTKQDQSKRDKSSRCLPWKRNKRNAKTKNANPFDNIEIGKPLNLPKTVRGDLGGSARDFELLAELKAISSNAKRFEEDENIDNKNITNKETAQKAVKPIASASKQRRMEEPPTINSALRTNDQKNRNIKDTNHVSFKDSISTCDTELASIPENSDSTNQIIVTKENIENVLNSTEWKLRKEAYAMLSTWLSEKVNGKEGANDLECNEIIPSANEIIVNLVREPNVAALDAALTFAILYADHCKSASEAEHAASICTSLLKGPALSSRPTTIKLAKALIMKLMEVGRDGCCSVHSVVTVLLTDGLDSKKTKVVLNTGNLVLEAAQAFGAATLPLAILLSNVSKLLSNSTSGIREIGVKVVAELCRAMGSKDHTEDVIGSMKPSQVSDLDKLLNEQKHPSPPSICLRSMKNSSSSSSALPNINEMASMNQPTVNLINEIKQTDYAAKIKEVKWSEKVSALDTLIRCGGRKPYKLSQPSESINYCALIHELKELLKHTHFAVKSKAMTALGMLAEGVGAKLLHQLKPLIDTILELSKDKKVTKSSQSCLDSFFGNVIGANHLLENEGPIVSAVSDKAHPLVREFAFEFLRRCIDRSEIAGPRGSINVAATEKIVKICCKALKDSVADVRKVAHLILEVLLKNEKSSIRNEAERQVSGLKESNPRAYKTLLQNNDSTSHEKTACKVKPRKKVQERNKKSFGESTESTVVGKSEQPSPIKSRTGGKSESSPIKSRTGRKSESSRIKSRTGEKSESSRTKSRTGEKSEPSRIKSRTGRINRKPSPTKSLGNPSQPKESVSKFIVEKDEESVPSIEESIKFLSELNIPNWDALEDEGGILAGIKSLDWKHRKEAISSLICFSRSNEAKEVDSSYSSHVLGFVKEYSKSFNERNLNLSKAILELFQAVCDLNILLKRQLEMWICQSASTFAVEKISDKKLSHFASNLLSSLCEVQPPEVVIAFSIMVVELIKSPLPHKDLLEWSKGFCNDFGAASLGRSVSNCVEWALKECGEVKTKAAALALIGEMNIQLGPLLKAVIASTSNINNSIHAQIEHLLDSNPFDPAAGKQNRKKKCFTINDGTKCEIMPLEGIKIPKKDLVAMLPLNCIKRMGTKEGKSAWKTRKQALDEVEDACKECAGIISTAPKSILTLIELCKALKDRLSDLQTNLRPLAAQNIGFILGSVESVPQAKLSRIVFRSLINVAITDNKKIVRLAAMNSLEKCTKNLDIDGGGVNPLAMKSFMIKLVAELQDSQYKAIGLPCVLEFAAKNAEYFPKIESMSKPRDRALEEQFTALILGCATSSKAETRTAAELLLMACTKFGVTMTQSIEKGLEKFSQVEQRNVRLALKSVGAGRPEETPRNDNQRNKKLAMTRGKNDSDKLLKQGVEFSADESNNLLNVQSILEDGHGTRNSHSSKESNNSCSSELPGNSNNCSTDKLKMLLNDSHFVPVRSKDGIENTKTQRTSRSSRRHDPWPDYPDVPFGWNLFKSMKRAWAPLLPPESVGILFPSKGILKQEDALNGCILLSHALKLLQASKEEEILISQLDLLNKWLAFAICSSESSVGMEGLVSFMQRLFSFLQQKQYQMTAIESGLILPYLLQRAGDTQERFRVELLDLLSSVSNNVYPMAHYGPMVCISVIEMSEIVRAKVLATQECHRCVKNFGLAGIGKKGIRLVAKTLSEDTSFENKSVYLDLIETIIQNMGSLEKYIEFCGSVNLSTRARQMVEKRWLKHRKLASPETTGRGSPAETTRRLSPTETTKRRSPTETTKRRSPTETTKRRSPTETIKRRSPRETTKRRSPTEITKRRSPTETTSRSQTVETPGRELPARWALRRSIIMEGSEGISSDKERSIHKKVTNNGFSDSSTQRTDVTSGGISLRDRLRQISNRHLCAKVYDSIMSDIDDLLAEPTPLVDESTSLVAQTGLRRINAAITKDVAVQSVEKEATVLKELRSTIKENLPFVVARLASVLRYSLRCGTASNPDGFSLPLISISVATLMAIVMDSTLSVLITEEVLVVVLHRVISALLDRHLTGKSKLGSHHSNKAATKKIFKAMNKLAHQSTLRVRMHISFQSLLSLQLQICSACIQEGISTTDVDNVQNRMSQIVSKLFLEVITKLEREEEPVSLLNTNLTFLLESLEDILKKTRYVKDVSDSGSHSTAVGILDSDFICDDRMTPVLKLGRMLMLSLLKSKTNENVKKFTNTLPEVSLVKRLYQSCCTDIGVTPVNVQSEGCDIRCLSELIYAVGRAKEGEEIVHVFENLRNFVEEHNGIDIENHLSTLSAPFREYIRLGLKDNTIIRPQGRRDSLVSGYSGSSRALMDYHSMESFSSGIQSEMWKSCRSLTASIGMQSNQSEIGGTQSDLWQTPSSGMQNRAWTPMTGMQNQAWKSLRSLTASTLASSTLTSSTSSEVQTPLGTYSLSDSSRSFGVQSESSICENPFGPVSSDVSTITGQSFGSESMADKYADLQARSNAIYMY